MLIASYESGRLRPHAQIAFILTENVTTQHELVNVAINQDWFTHTESMTLYERDRFSVIDTHVPNQGHLLLDSITSTYTFDQNPPTLALVDMNRVE
jgi:hypothetical protein